MTLITAAQLQKLLEDGLAQREVIDPIRTIANSSFGEAICAVLLSPCGTLIACNRVTETMREYFCARSRRAS